MQRWIALLRGVNVGGNRKLPMADLRAALAGDGLRDVASYIQSGNIVFSADGTSETLAARIGAVIARAFGFETEVLVLSAERLGQVMAANPFPEAEADPAKLYLHFLFAPLAELDETALSALARDGERFALRKGVFYLHAPAGIGRSDLAAKLARLIPVPMTARNLRSCRRILQMAQGAA